MAHFVETDKNNVVLRVVVIDDKYEASGTVWCNKFFGGGTWLQTSYNATTRKNFAGVGFTYDASLDAFIPPQPFPSWTLDNTSCQWIPPTPMPSTGGAFVWDENLLDWQVPSF